MNKYCIWIYDDCCCFWETKCGEGYCVNCGTPKDNKIKFCPFCGKEILERHVRQEIEEK